MADLDEDGYDEFYMGKQLSEEMAPNFGVQGMDMAMLYT